MGWPDATADLKAFYPTSLLETGLDILFFWVARMVMMGLELTDVLPFHTVFLHAMVRDKEGRKMSKSLGNVIDPLEVINGCSLDSLQQRLEAGNLPQKEVVRAKKNNEEEFPEGIPECGSDALRFGLLAYTVQGRDINLDVKRVVAYRMFCNKLWNATKFALKYLVDFRPTPTLLGDSMQDSAITTRDKFIVSRLMNGSEIVNDYLSTYKFGDAQKAAHSLWMDDICDVYLELIKPVMNGEDEGAKKLAQGVLWVALEWGLRLLHPMMPFVTEELWQRLPGRGTLGDSEPESIMLAKYPEKVDQFTNIAAEKSMACTMKIVKACRSLRASYNIEHKTLTTFYMKVSGEDEMYLRDQLSDVATLARASAVLVNVEEGSIPQSVGTIVVDDSITVLVDLKGIVDFKVEIARQQKGLGKTKALIDSLTKRMSTPGYDERVPQALKEQNIEKLEALTKKKEEQEKLIENFERLASL